MTGQLRTIVAGIATLEPDDPALAASIHLAERTGADLHLVHVHPSDEEDEGWEAPVRGIRRPDVITALLQSRLAGLARTLSANDRVECVVLCGKAAEVLSGYARVVGADLLVLAPTRRAGAAGAVLGTTAQRVLRTSAAPVLVLRGELAGHAARRVLLPTDLSEHSARALPLAQELAAALAAPREPVLLPLFVEVPDVDTDAPAIVAAQLDLAQADLAIFLASLPGAPLTGGTVRVGSPAHEILAVARQWDADLVVLGTHGRRGLPRFFLGSVAETVLRKAPCSALVIPPAAVLQRPEAEAPIAAPWNITADPQPRRMVPVL
ncbi:MAG TPA: universal stress protein [Longimicrobium sp.]|nr:universal stress protein [Longimicrobium sp.]